MAPDQESTIASPTGRFCWHDLSVDDIPAARAFYTALFGWSIVPHGDDYMMWQNVERMLGGLMPLPDQAKAMGAPPHWLGYTQVEDVGVTVAKAQELGAQVFVSPTPIPDFGTFAVLADPQGAAFAVFASAGDPGDAAEALIGDFSWGELATTDSQAAGDFYAALFGWVFEDMEMGEMGVYRLFKTPDAANHLGGIFTKPAAMPGPSAWIHYVTVDNIDDAATRVRELGGRLLNGPMDVPGGDRVAQCMDSQGAAFALHQRVAPR